MSPERNQAELSSVRSAYAKLVMLESGVQDSRLEAAFAKVPREKFLAPGPWAIMRPPAGYQMTPDGDPIRLYQNVLVGMISEKGLNNGQPSSLALLISFGRPREGEHAVHIGAGQGYYTAIVAELVGGSGKVMAIEYEQELAEHATANLSPFPQVRVIHGDGTAIALPSSDVIYVNAGAVRPANVWLNALKDGGRLVLPLTVSFTFQGYAMTRGAVFLIERRGEEFIANWKSDFAIYPCAGERDEISEKALANAFEKGGWERVTRLYRTKEIEAERCWVSGPDWSLAYS